MTKIMLDYKLVEAMAMVAQEGGFDKAARILHITQSAVSQRIKLLEEQTGQILLARTNPPCATVAGRNLLRHYRQVKQLEDDLLAEITVKNEANYTSIAIALNADSLATWFIEAMYPLLLKEGILLDLHVDDQEQTHQLLKNGDVIGCISTTQQPLQGCKSYYIGQMHYQLLATPKFAKHWFPAGLDLEGTRGAPAIIYNRKDELHQKILSQVLGSAPDTIPTSYIPSSEKFAEAIFMGLGYGMLPLQQGEPALSSGTLVNLVPAHKISVQLYWHCWNLKSPLLTKITEQLTTYATTLLDEFSMGKDHAPE